MTIKKQLFFLSTAIVAGCLSPAHATLIDTGNVSPSNATTQNSGTGQMYVGFSGGNGTFEVNSSSVGNGYTSANASALIIGRDGSQGTVQVIGNGISGSAQINISTGVGLRNSMGGTGILEITNGGIVHSAENIYLGTQGLGSTAGTATTLIDGSGSILRTQQSSTGEVWQRDGGRIYVGFDGQSDSTVNINNGGLMQALSGNAGDSGDDGSLFIGSGDAGSTATVNVSGMESIITADTYLEVGARATSTNSSLNISNGGQVEVFRQGTPTAEMYISTVAGEATVNVNGTNSSLSAENIQIGGKTAVAGFTNSGSPVISADFNTMVEGQQVSDTEGNLIFDRAGSPVLAVIKVFSGGYETLIPETFNDENRIYIKNTGALIVENSATVNTQTIEISTNEPTALPYNNQGAMLTVRTSGTVTGDVIVNKDGILNGDGGIINGNVTVDGGSIAPGNSPGTLIINGDLTLTSGFIELEIGEFQRDLLSVIGNVEIGENSMLSIVLDSGVTDQTLNLVDLFDISGVFNIDSNFNLANNIEISGLSDDTNLTINFFEDQVIIGNGGSPVPVPSAILLFVTGLVGLRAVKKSVT